MTVRSFTSGLSPVSLAVIFGLSFCLFLQLTLDLSVAVPADLPASLPVLVRDYLETLDPDRAHRILAEILAHPETSLQEIEAAIRLPQIRSVQPIGPQPGLPIRVRGRAFHYALYVPLSYTPTKEYALVLCLHGAGFTGDSYLERWQTRLGEEYILACPTIPLGEWWTREAADLILATMEEVRGRYRVDPDRIFLTGMSNGGIGVYLVGSHYASLFAGLAPMAGGLDDVLFPFLENLRHTPVYVIHGAKDQVMPVQLSRSVARELMRLGYPFVYREHDRIHPIAGGHYFPREELPDLIAWFGSQRRDPLPIKVTVVRDATHLIPFSWVRIDATDRIAAFSDNLADSHDENITNRRYAKLDADIIAPNRIEVRTELVRRYSLFLNHTMVDFSRPVTIVANGTTVHESLVTPRVETMLREARQRHDRRALFSVVLTFQVQDES